MMMDIIREQPEMIPKVGRDTHWNIFGIFPNKGTKLASLGGT